MGQHHSAESRPGSPDAFPSHPLKLSRSTLIKTLEYIGMKLAERNMHIKLVVTGKALSCLKFKSTRYTSEVSVLQATSLTSREYSVLASAVRGAEQKFPVGPNWANNDLERQYSEEELDMLSSRSIIQNDVVFSSGGLTLLAVDLCFALKYNLGCLTQCLDAGDLEDTVAIVRRLVVAYRGRALTRGYITRCYSGIAVSDYALLRVNAAYEAKYGSRGICGVNDDFFKWRREGRVDLMDLQLDFDFSSTSSSPIDPTLMEEAPICVRYGYADEDSETSTPQSVSPVPRSAMENFLRSYNC